MKLYKRNAKRAATPEPAPKPIPDGSCIYCKNCNECIGKIFYCCSYDTFTNPYVDNTNCRKRRPKDQLGECVWEWYLLQLLSYVQRKDKRSKYPNGLQLRRKGWQSFLQASYDSKRREKCTVYTYFLPCQGSLWELIRQTPVSGTTGGCRFNE